MSIYNKQLKNQLASLANVLGYQVGYNNGCIFIDNVPATNLWRIIKKDAGGQECHLFGEDCFTKKDLIQAIRFANRCIQLDRLNGETSSQYWASNKCDIN